MSYYYCKELKDVAFDRAVERTREELDREGFSVLTIIDMKVKFKEKLNADFKQYTILGACNASLAHEILQIEDKLGLMMPCNVVVQEKEEGIEVTVIDPTVAMVATGNDTICDAVEKVKIKLQNVIERL